MERLEAIEESSEAGTAKLELCRWVAGQGGRQAEDLLAREEPLEIRVRGRAIAVTMRTPGEDPELAAGFLLGEGLITRREDILEIGPCLQAAVENAGNVLNVFVAPTVDVDFERLTRHVFTTSSCGLCGRASIEAVRQRFPRVNSPMSIRPQLILTLPGRLRSAQSNFAQTGGLHAAALFDGRGELLVVREDVGRHNAVDKCIGFALLNDRIPLDEHILMVSGRASFEIVQKAWAAGIPVVAAISAASSLAVECARESGQTLVGFVRGESMNIYTGVERIQKC